MLMQTQEARHEAGLPGKPSLNRQRLVAAAIRLLGWRVGRRLLRLHFRMLLVEFGLLFRRDSGHLLRFSGGAASQNGGGQNHDQQREFFENHFLVLPLR